MQLGLCPSHMPLDSANQCPTVEKKSRTEEESVGSPLKIR